VKIKFCGLRRTQDIEFANQTAPEYVGFVFAPSRRQVSPEEAGQLALKLNPGILKVGVFVNETMERVLEAVQAAGLEVVQLHGEEDLDFILALRQRLGEQEIWKAVRTSDKMVLLAADQLPADKLLLDAFTPGMAGGTGVTADWDLIRSAQAQLTKPYFLAGGLNLVNIPEALKVLEPYGIDLSSGIETAGVKDLDKMMAIVKQVRRT
jgi:phosphoribosylanthranilate isomerase